MAEVASRGCLGLEMQEAEDGFPVAMVYFPAPPTRAIEQLLQSSEGVPGGHLLAVDEIEDKDWLAAYREQSVPFPVGRRWLVDPREPGSGERSDVADRQLLRIPARSAFGIGSHASTRLLVELLDSTRIAGKRVLDLGTGTGILAMMAVSDGARFVVGVDHDPLAACLARSNAGLNKLRPHLIAGSLAAIRVGAHRAKFDLAFANILPDSLKPDLADLVCSLRPQAHLLVSGLLIRQEAELVSELEGLGMHPRRRREEDEWLALDLERTRP